MLLDTDKYLSIPFVMGGRDWDGADCYGLVRLFLITEKNIFLPLFSGITDKKNILKKTNQDKDIYGTIVKKDYKFGDVFILKSITCGIHYGVYIGNNEIIHTTEQKGVCIENITYQNIKNRLLWVYRPC